MKPEVGAGVRPTGRPSGWGSAAWTRPIHPGLLTALSKIEEGVVVSTSEEPEREHLPLTLGETSDDGQLMPNSAV